MRMLDLFCGRFGWGRAFAARGWEVVGVDLVAPPEVPTGCRFVQGDILALSFSPAVGFYFVGGQVLGFFDWVCASSPCEKFSVHGLKCFHPNPPYPELGIRLFNHTRSLCEASGVPYVMENVRAAQTFVGRAAHHCGPFYLWGTGVPMLMPQGIQKNCFTKWIDSKGNVRSQGPTGRAGRPLGERGVAACIERTAKAATIPPELAACVADYAERLLERAA